MLIPLGYAQNVITIRHSALSRPAAVVFGTAWELTAPDLTNSDNIFDAFAQAFDNGMDNQVTIGPIKHYIGDSIDGTSTRPFENPRTSFGLQAGDYMPPNVAMLLKKNTASGGRRNRGRMFLPWALRDVDVDDAGNLVGTVQADQQVRASTFIVDLQGAPGNDMVILHNDPPVTPTPVTTLIVDGRVATQRERLGR